MGNFDKVTVSQAIKDYVIRKLKEGKSERKIADKLNRLQGIKVSSVIANTRR